MAVKKPVIYYLLLSVGILLWPALYLPSYWSYSHIIPAILAHISILLIIFGIDLISDNRIINSFSRGSMLVLALYMFFDALILKITSITFYESMVIFSLGGDFILTMIEAGFPPILLTIIPLAITALIALGSFIASKTPFWDISALRKPVYLLTILLLLITTGEQILSRNKPGYMTRRVYPVYPLIFDTNQKTVALPLTSPLKVPKNVLSTTKIKEKPKDILFILLESFRHDAVTKDSAPHLNAFNQKNIHFTGALGDGIYTSLSWNALLLNRPAWTIDRDVRTIRNTEEGSLFFRILKSAGYKTAVASSANMNWNSFYKRINGSGLIDSFYSPYSEHDGLSRNKLDTITINSAISFHKKHKKTKPLFLMVQLDSTHWTYFPDKKLSLNKPSVDTIDMLGLTNKEAILPVYNKYINSVRTVDDRIGKLLNYLKKSGAYKDMIICIVSDHGDGFNPGRVGHSVIHDEIRRIYLSMKIPGHGKKTISSMVQHRDVFPTLFSEAGITGLWKNYFIGQNRLRKGKSSPKIIYHGSLRMAELVYPHFSVRYAVRIRNNMVYATPLFMYDGKDFNKIKMIDKNHGIYNKDFIRVSMLTANENK